MVNDTDRDWSVYTPDSIYRKHLKYPSGFRTKTAYQDLEALAACTINSIVEMRVTNISKSYTEPNHPAFDRVYWEKIDVATYKWAPELEKSLDAKSKPRVIETAYQRLIAYLTKSNRPDGEEANSPETKEFIKKWAEEFNGMDDEYRQKCLVAFAELGMQKPWEMERNVDGDAIPKPQEALIALQEQKEKPILSSDSRFRSFTQRILQIQYGPQTLSRNNTGAKTTVGTKNNYPSFKSSTKQCRD